MKIRDVPAVVLVGAGPGDPELITVGGLAALREAEVVVYDRLASPELLKAAPAEALLIDAGKAPGAHTLGQEAINALLAEHALAGRRVVRLKGGDPFVFGRGGEEALYLRERGIRFRVLPGVTSAVAAAAYAGIPVTHRGVASSFMVLTGHEASGQDSDEPGAIDWAAVARAADTLVVLMGVERLGAISARLIEAGRPAEQPAALVQWGTTPQQRVLVATLGTIAERARAEGMRSPAALVAGDVVALRDRLAWFETAPLFGARVLVTRARTQASGLAARLRALGAVPVEFPAIAVQPVADPAGLDAALRDLGRQDWTVFASQNAVGAAFERLDALALDARAFALTRICAVGLATARALAERGLRADLVPEEYTSAGILAALRSADVQGARVLLLSAEVAPLDLADGLCAVGAEVSRVAAYRTAGGGQRAELEALLAEGVDAVTFTSSSTVGNVLNALEGDTTALERAIIVSIGPSTSATARAGGLRVDAEADPHTIDGVIEALVAQWTVRGDRG